MFEKLLKIIHEEQNNLLEYGWVFSIVFFLVLFLSQGLYVAVLGGVGSSFGWLALLVWSFGATYFLLFGNSQLFATRIKEKITTMFEEKIVRKGQIKLSRIPEIENLSSRPSEPYEHVDSEGIAEKTLENYAHDKGALISKDALSYIALIANDPYIMIEDVIAKARTVHPRFDGWVVLNKTQVKDLLNGKMNTFVKPVYSDNDDVVEETEDEIKKVYTGQTEKDIYREEPITDFIGDRKPEPIQKPQESTTSRKKNIIGDKKNVEVPANLPVGTLQSPESTAIGTFMGLLCEGDEHGLFTFMRRMKQGDKADVTKFLREAVLMLDRIHEHRLDGVGYVDQNVLEHTRCFSNDELEQIIAILITSIDYRYDVPEIGIKLSLVRALEFIKKTRKN